MLKFYLLTFQRRHNLVYDMGSANESLEWVNLSEVYLLLMTVM
jgi:hypothetical protein